MINPLYSQIYRRIDRARVHTKVPEIVKFNRVSLYNNENCKNQVRAGIIPYTFHNDKLYFGFGVDTKTSDLTDFGGGVQFIDNGAINAAIREFREETLGVFEPLWSNDLNGQHVIYNDRTLIVLLYCGNIDPRTITQNFKKKALEYKTVQGLEVKSIIWLSFESLKDSLENYGYRIYSRVKNLLKNPSILPNLLPTLSC